MITQPVKNGKIRDRFQTRFMRGRTRSLLRRAAKITTLPGSRDISRDTEVRESSGDSSSSQQK